MLITFDLPHVFYPGSSPRDNALVLNSLLEFLIDVNMGYLRYHKNTPSLYQSGVYYKRTNVWDAIPALYARGYGDCKSLSAALVAQYQMQGIKCRPVFRFADNAKGGRDFHILVQVDNNSAEPFEDPSRKLGMGSDELKWFR